MKLGECTPGDVVVIEWPASDWQSWLCGTQQFIRVGNVLGGRKKCTAPHSVLVSFVDPSSLVCDESSWRGISPEVEVIERIERYGGGDDGDGRGDGEDFVDPMRGRQR